MYRTFLYIVFACTLILVNVACSEQRVLPNKYESAYVTLAYDTKSPAWCEKISRQATQRYGFNRGGADIYYTRSSCFLTLAILLKDSSLCRKVRQAREIPILGLDGSKYSRRNCNKLIQSGEEISGRRSLPLDLNERSVLQELNLTELHLEPCQIRLREALDAAPSFVSRYEACGQSSYIPIDEITKVQGDGIGYMSSSNCRHYIADQALVFSFGQPRQGAYGREHFYCEGYWLVEPPNFEPKEQPHPDEDELFIDLYKHYAKSGIILENIDKLPNF